MFEYDPRYYRKARLSPGSSLKAKEFRPDDFSPPGEYESPGAAASALPHQPEFEDFGRRQPDFEPEVDPDRDLPSLDDLFKPFELDQENKSQDEPYEDLCSPEVETFQYEDLDTRPPEVIHTLATAREEAASLVKAAQNQAEELMKKARNEAAALIASLKRREEEKQAAAREAIENLRQNVRERLTEAEAAAAAAENERLEAEKREAEAERRLAEAADRLAGLGEERKRLEEEYAAKLEELTKSKDEVMAEAKKAGQEEGRREGLAAGRESGRAEALEKFNLEVADFRALAEKLENLYEELWQINSPMMVKLAVEAAEHIVNKELSESEDLAVHAFRAAIDYLSQAHQVTVLVRPQDIAKLELAKAEQREKLGALVKVAFKGDETLGPGDLIIESDVGRLDATIKHRMGQVLDALRRAFSEGYEQPATSAQKGPAETADVLDVEFESDKQSADNSAGANDSRPPVAEEKKDSEKDSEDELE